MRFVFKQRFRFGLDSYNIFNESGEVAYTVQSRFSFIYRKLDICDRWGYRIGSIKSNPFIFYPKFNMYIGESCIGTIRKRNYFFQRPRYILDCNGWEVRGTFWEWDYTILDATGIAVATLHKEFAWTDTYVLDIYDEANILGVLMVVVAIDTEKDTRSY